MVVTRQDERRPSNLRRRCLVRSLPDPIPSLAGLLDPTDCSERPVNLSAIVRTYTVRIRPRAEDELEWFRDQPTLASAINVAAMATNRRGNRHRHQTRL